MISTKERNQIIYNQIKGLIKLFHDNKFIISQTVIKFVQINEIKIANGNKLIDVYCILIFLYLKCIINPEISKKDENNFVNTKAEITFIAESNFILYFFTNNFLEKDINFYKELLSLMKFFVIELYGNVCSVKKEFLEHKNQFLHFVSEKISFNNISYLSNLQFYCQHIYSIPFIHSSFASAALLLRNEFIQ